ncbi:MAG: periplasmic heavy metal sensor [Bacteriovoracaceae bacterium]|jgi:tyrosyl-tRNA synthetase|nr:periplasmic heavy metal sensor [Bacteriovoracaceae bacterium]
MNKLFGVFLIMVFVFACSSTVKEEIEEEKKSVMGVDNREQMISRTRDILEKSENLTKEQREKFLELHSEIMKDVAEINQEIRKSKVVLFKAIVAKDYNQDKAEVLTKSIKKLFRKKLELMITGMGEAKEILGVSSEEVLEFSMPIHINTL